MKQSQSFVLYNIGRSDPPDQNSIKYHKVKQLTFFAFLCKINLPIHKNHLITHISDTQRGWNREPKPGGGKTPQSVIDSGVDIITKENVEEYANKWKILIINFWEVPQPSTS